MTEQSARERDYHNRIAELTGGTCWANVKPAGQLRQNLRAKLAMEYISLSNGKRVLEIGCGDGEFSKRFLNAGADMYCVDISPKLIEVLREQYRDTNLKFETANAERLPYADEYFDAIIGNGVLHHLSLDNCLKEIYRVLKKEGRIFFAEPNMLNPEVFLETKIRWVGKIARKTEDEKAFLRWVLKRKLEETGFKSIAIIPFDFLQPLTPGFLIGIVRKAGDILEKTPLVKEIAGSLKITGKK